VLRTLRNISHLARVGYVLAREGVFARIDPKAAPPEAALPLAIARLLARKDNGDDRTRLSRAIGRLGPSYVKLGQFLATRPDVVGTALANDLTALQDRMPAFPREQAIASMDAALDQPSAVLFAEIGEPVAAASIAQVHKGRLPESAGGHAVAIKVLRPGVARRFKRDLDAFYFGARLAAGLPGMERLKPVAVVDVLARSVAMEMDLRLEAAALSEMRENTADDVGFRVPAPDWTRTGREVLTMEWIDGIRLSDREALVAAGHDLKALGRTVIQSFLRHAIRDGFFHADMHQGNLFVDPAGNLVAVDFGIMGRIGPNERRFLAEILYGFIRRDYQRVAEVHFEAGYVPPVHAVEDFAQAIRAVGEPIHQRRADEISMAKLLTLLFEVTDLFDMQTRTELVMLQKTMVVVEGVARSLDPRLDMWTTAEPVVREWIERNLGPVGQLEQAGTEVSRLARGVLAFPRMLTRMERMLADYETLGRQGVGMLDNGADKLGQAERQGRRWSNLLLWLIVLGLVVLAARGL
jgi:ubiquinone biosynthesis protein